VCPRPKRGDSKNYKQVDCGKGGGKGGEKEKTTTGKYRLSGETKGGVTPLKSWSRGEKALGEGIEGGPVGKRELMGKKVVGGKSAQGWNKTQFRRTERVAGGWGGGGAENGTPANMLQPDHHFRATLWPV